MNLINMLKNIGYEEFIPALPEQIKIELAKKEHTQILRNRMMILFFITTFIAVTCAVLSAIVNPYWCYPVYGIMDVALIIIYFIVCQHESSREV